MHEMLGKLLGLDNVREIDAIGLSLAAAWAQERVFWVALGAIGLLALAIVFYLRWQAAGPRPWRLVLGTWRGVLLVLLLLTLADPVLQLTLTHSQPAHLYLVFDGTDSMSLEDEYTTEERDGLLAGVGIAPDDLKSSALPATRSDWLRAWLSRRENNTLEKLVREKDLDVSAFVFDGQTTSKLRRLQTAPGDKAGFDPQHLASQLSTAGQVTAIGAALGDATHQTGSGNLAGIVLFSDFAQNAGPLPLTAASQSPARRLGVPIYTVGIGAVNALDLAVDLQADPKMKKAERSQLLVKLRQTGLEGRTVAVTVTGRRLSSASGASSAETEFTVGTKSVTCDLPVMSLEFPYTPDEAGRCEFTARVEKLPGESVEQNNESTRETQIIDDYLRLLYVANEPNWEWRFVKEVFHRDKLVGMDGFRTFLGSSDPRVRESNVLFLPTLTPRRSEFFANDVIFLADMPRGALNDRFCEMLREFVGNLGGGLVIITGPQHGIRDYPGTPLADMLPVIPDPQLEIRTAPKYTEFRPRLTPHASRYSFMQLGETENETHQAWDNLGRLPWYQPVAAVHEQATVLAEYPAAPGETVHVCRDGKTPQPLVAIRPYGRGEVVYVAFNEMWRLRRMHGEKYYRAFWSQLIYRLGMSHAMGSEKRFVARLDQPQYRVDDKVHLAVEAYDENYQPLDEEKLAGRPLLAELQVPPDVEAGETTRPVAVPMLRPGMFEAAIPVYQPGEYALRVTDPITKKITELRFEVTNVSAERRRAVRDLKLQTELASETRGRSYDLATVGRLVDDLKLAPKLETQTRNVPLWTTPWWFGLVVALMLGEWLARKLTKLT